MEDLEKQRKDVDASLTPAQKDHVNNGLLAVYSNIVYGQSLAAGLVKNIEKEKVAASKTASLVPKPTEQMGWCYRTKDASAVENLSNQLKVHNPRIWISTISDFMIKSPSGFLCFKPISDEEYRDTETYKLSLSSESDGDD
jgi:hypothetical protein